VRDVEMRWPRPVGWSWEVVRALPDARADMRDVERCVHRLRLLMYGRFGGAVLCA
jgi:hypothetical protein